MPVNALQGAQFYVNCAHLRVVNEGVGWQPESEYEVSIPGMYRWGQDEIYRWVDVGNETFDIGDWVEPKPKVWEG